MENRERDLKKIMSRWRVLFAVASLGTGSPAMAAPAPSVPAAAIPTIQCIHRALQSSSAVQSISLYSIDDFRFAVEFSFRNKAGRIVVSDIEFFELDGAVIIGDKVPREVSVETASEGQELVDLDSICHLNGGFDNLLPQPNARADWQRIDWPNE